MKKFKAILLALAMCATLSAPALAQDRDHDGDHDRGRHRGWVRPHDNGLHRGWYKDRDGDWDRDYRHRTYVYPRYYGNSYYVGPRVYVTPGYRVSRGYYYGNGSAAQFGYRDGLVAGRRDRITGHSYRPYEWAAYRDGDHGLSISGYGSSGFYRQQYRQAFLNGYNEGYGSVGYWRR